MSKKAADTIDGYPPRRRRQGAWWAPRSSKPVWGRELPGGFDSRPPPRRFNHANPGRHEVRLDGSPGLHDDPADHRGEQLLDLLRLARGDGFIDGRPEVREKRRGH